MNPLQLLGIIENANRLSKDEFKELMKLHESFPYFQIPKVLLAKYEYDKSKGKVNELLHWAAITSPDRAWLKKMVETESPFQKPNNPKVEDDKNVSTPIETEKPQNIIDVLEGHLIPETKKTPNTKDLTATLKKLGEDLAKSKLRAMEKLDGNITRTSIEPAPIEEIPVENSPIPAEDKAKENPIPSDTSKVDESIAKKPKNRGQRDELIESIRKKEKKEIVDKKKLEQIDIIKAFSKKEIKLATLKEIEEIQKQDDLSEKSTQLHAALVTESYASILVKQGKNAKAKEIYKKLMVRFPEKSTYFADLIKKLENN